MKKDFISKLITAYIWPLKMLFSKNHTDFVMNSICKSFDGDSYVSYRLRALHPTTSVPIIDSFCVGDKFAILLQGPIGNGYEFLFESIKYYKKIYYDAIIIVSTWNDEKPNVIKSLRRHGVMCVQSEKPKLTGTLNVNLQIISTLAGIRKARELGIKFVAKTRTDQRICKPYILYSLMDMIQLFKPSSSDIKYRIVATSTFCNNMFTPYYLSDFFFLGQIDEIEKYFSCPLDERHISHPGKISRKKLSESMYPPEVYLMKNYLRKYLGQNCEDTIKEYWQCLKDYFICVSRSDVDLFSMKYKTSKMDHINNSEYFPKDTQRLKYLMGFNFWTWSELYFGNIKYKDEYEKEAEIEVD